MEKMNTAWTRRTFLGSGMTGAGALAVMPAAGLLGGGGRLRSEDGMLDGIIRELEAAVHMLRDAPTGEAARRIASANRLFVDWGKDRGIDEQTKRQLRDLLRREGRAAVLVKPFDPVAELKLRGYDLPSGTVARAQPADRARIFDQVLANGVTPQWSAMAEAWELIAGRLDKRAEGALRVRLDDEPYCKGEQLWELFLEVMTFATCMFPALLPLCLIYAVQMFGWKLSMALDESC